MKIGILREEKHPKDTRVPLTPSQCRAVNERFENVEVVVQPSDYRCFTNEEYKYHDIQLVEDLSDCDMIFGVKEVPKHLLIQGKRYAFFSHTIKKQPQNRGLLQEVLKRNITLIDYECMVDEKQNRIIAFGRWAGIVGAYHAIRMIGARTGRYRLRQMVDCKNFSEAQKEFKKLDLPPLKIVLTGTGRVSKGAAFLLDTIGIKKVDPHSFCYKEFDEIVYTQLGSKDMYFRRDQDEFDRADFHAHSADYESTFYPFTKVADVMINGVFWQKSIPAFFTSEQMKEKDFKIKSIADITCDVAPDSSIPSTIFASTIDDPYYGYNPQTEQLCQSFTSQSIDMMSIDNLPNELPRDASEDFGNMIITRVIPELFKENSRVLIDATIAAKGSLNTRFGYLKDYVQ
jgi:saccharopine dehydrogenase (NAD+, L-lysine-forming)